MKNNLMKWILAGVFQLGLTHVAMGMDGELTKQDRANLEEMRFLMKVKMELDAKEKNSDTSQHTQAGLVQTVSAFVAPSVGENNNNDTDNKGNAKTVQNDNNSDAEDDGEGIYDLFNPNANDTAPNSNLNPGSSVAPFTPSEPATPVNYYARAGYIALGAIAVVGLVYGSYKLVKYFQNKNTDKPAPAN